jgi:hypothetical protein
MLLLPFIEPLRPPAKFAVLGRRRFFTIQAIRGRLENMPAFFRPNINFHWLHSEFHLTMSSH